MLGKLSGAIVLVCAAVLTFWFFPAEATQFATIYQFPGGTRGTYPDASLINDSNGNLYGTTAGGGGTGCKTGCGIVFELSQSNGIWTESVLYSFGGPPNDGAVPVAGLIFDSSGNLYGTTSQGNQNVDVGCNGYGCGTVFKLSQSNGSWTESVLHSFKGGSDGQDPRAALVMDAAGYLLYGTTAEGGISRCGYFQTGCGTVFAIAADSTKRTLYSFEGTHIGDGESPRAALILDGEGNLYGTTMSGGSTSNSNVCVYESCGTVFELVPGRITDTVLYSFKGGASDGGNPVSSVLFDQNGNVDGTTLYGGSNDCYNYGCGTVFQLASSGGETLLHQFSPNDGEAPVAGLIPDPLSGNFDGVACGERCNGGAPTRRGAPTKICGKSCHYGTVFRVQPNEKSGSQFTVLQQFNNKNGSSPSAPLLLNKNNNTLYGTTQNGGKLKNCFAGCGTVFSIALDPK